MAELDESGQLNDFAARRGLNGALAGVVVITLAGAWTHFWRLGIPKQPVFDETTVLQQAGSYLRGWPFFLSLQPPLGKLLVAADIGLLGDHSWSWRIGSAGLGTALIPLTYFLARRAFRSRAAGIFACLMLALDGLFLVSSRLGMINIVYMTSIAAALLCTFAFEQSRDAVARRRLTAAIGVALGLCLAAKTGISAVTFALVMGLLVFNVFRTNPPPAAGSGAAKRIPLRAIAGTVALSGGLAASVYMLAFAPYYCFGWWSGAHDFVQYHRWMLQSNLSLPHISANSSPFWSWPLMLRPFPYWKDAGGSTVRTVWCGGNPLLWWEVLPALALMAKRGWRARDPARIFLGIAYLAYMLMWLPIPRYLLSYDYMPALYIGVLALGDELARTWRGESGKLESLVLLAPLGVGLFLGLSRNLAVPIGAAILIGYLAAATNRRYQGPLVCVLVTAAMVASFVLFFPLWTAMPLPASSYNARMWFKGPGLANWR